MAAFEDSYTSILQGVSEQIPQQRLDGQVTAQLNMLSDPVTGMRRRPGARYVYDIDWTGLTADNLLATDTDVAGVQVQVLVNSGNGTLKVLASDYSVLAELTSTYLITPDVRDLRTASVGDELFFLNTTKVPTAGPALPSVSPDSNGFVHIKAGAFNTAYIITVTWGAQTSDFQYVTPDGSGVPDAENSTPQFIADFLATAINGFPWTGAGLVATAEAGTIFLAGNGPALTLSTYNGASLVQTSGKGTLRLASDLPPKLGGPSDGYIIRVGEANAPTYYQWDTPTATWLESGDPAAPGSITNVPISLTQVGGVWALNSAAFEGRSAGSEDNNPTPEFTVRGCTGMGSYQGRLVLLSGPLLYMSASKKPRRFYRSTVTSLIDSDTIGVGAAAASSAAWVHAVQYDKDLLVFSEKHQAVVPGANTAITPRTANLVITSAYATDVTTSPVGAGRTVMFPTPRSPTNFGVMEMYPQVEADSKYTSVDTTEHLPGYFQGQCRDILVDTATNLVAFFPNAARQEVVLQQFAWSADKKEMQAWHKWEFKFPIAAAYLTSQEMHFLFVQNSRLVACALSPRSGVSSKAVQYSPALDVHYTGQVLDGVVPVPEWFQVFAADAVPEITASMSDGPRKTAHVGGAVEATDFVFVPEVEEEATVAFGFAYKSAVEPTPPMRKDRNGTRISSNKATVLRFMVGTNNSQEYRIDITDKHSPSDQEFPEAAPLGFYSTELELNTPLEGGADSVVVAPCRTVAQQTRLNIHTSGTGELNVVSLEYVMRYLEKVQRARF